MPYWPITVLLAVCGLALGSFGNVWILRFATGESLSGRSRCPHCKKVIAWYDLIPVVSFLLLRGHCRRCHKPLSLQYPIVEWLSALAMVLAWFHAQGDVLGFASSFLVLYGLILVSAFDLSFQQIPDVFNAVVLLGALLSFLSGMMTARLIGAAIALAWFGCQWIVSRGKIVGSGDVFLAISLGLWLGWAGTIALLFSAYILGGIVAGYLLLTGRERWKGSRIPFAPFLATGALLAWMGVGEAYIQFLAK